MVGGGPGAKRWVEPAKPKPSLYKATASHCFEGDTVQAIGDGMEPANSGDTGIPRLTFWNHRGTTEWVRYDFGQPKEVSEVGAYWFDDTGVGQCRLPKSWRLLYQDLGQWKPVPGATAAAVSKDQWNVMKFPPVKTSALRMEVDLQDGFSAGILEWRVK